MLVEARSCLAGRADAAGTFDAPITYEHALLMLDAINSDDVPALHTLPEPIATGCLPELTSIESLATYGVGELPIELVLALLADTQEQDTPGVGESPELGGPASASQG